MAPVTSAAVPSSPGLSAGQAPPAYAGGQVGSGARLGVLGNRNVFDTPFNIAGYTNKLIRDQQAQSVSDVVANDPSVRTVYSEGGVFGDTLNIRGFPINPNDIAFDGLYGILPQRSPSLQNIERVEVLKGPSALLYGTPPTGAIGGTVNLVPKRATDDPITRVTPFFMSQGTGGVSVDWGRRYGPAKEWGVRINGQFRDGETSIDKERLQVGFGSIALDYRGDRVRWSFDLAYQSNDGEALRGFMTVAPGIVIPPAPKLSRNLSQPWEFAKGTNLLASTRLEVDLSSNVTLYGAVGMGIYRESGLVGFQQLLNSAGFFAGPTYRQTWDTNTYSGEVGLRSKFDTGFLSHNVVVSGSIYSSEWKYPKLTQVFLQGINNIYSPILLPAPVYTDIPINQKFETLQNRGVSFADTISAYGDRIQLTVGGRYQQIAYTNYQAMVPNDPSFGQVTSRFDAGAWSPAVALLVKPFANLSIYANYIEGLQSGGIAPSYAANANQALPAVKADQKEIGVKYDFGRFGASIALFEINRPNAALDVVTLNYALNGVQRNRGIEFNIFGEPFAGFRLLGGLALTDGRLAQTANNLYNGNVAPGVPVTTANIYGEYDLPWLNGLTATGRVIYTSSQFYDQGNLQKIPAWTRVDSGLRYTFNGSWGKPVTLRANVENLFGANYYATVAQGAIGLGRPRTFLLSAQFDF